MLVILVMSMMLTTREVSQARTLTVDKQSLTLSNNLVAQKTFQFFRQMVTEKMLDEIVEQINVYAQ